MNSDHTSINSLKTRKKGAKNWGKHKTCLSTFHLILILTCKNIIMDINLFLT